MAFRVTIKQKGGPYQISRSKSTLEGANKEIADTILELQKEAAQRRANGDQGKKTFTMKVEDTDTGKPVYERTMKI